MGISLSGLTESSTGNLTLSAVSGSSVLIGNGSTQIYVDGSTDTLGIGGAAVSGSRLNIETGAVALDFITSTGTALNVVTDTVNDTSGAATLAIVPTVQIGVMTYTASNAMVYTDTASLYIAGIPVASNSGDGTVTFTNAAYALWVDDGAVRFDDRTLWIGGIAYEFPANNGSASEFLQTDGSGNLSWSSVASASVATTVTVTDNEDTNENNLIPFVANAATGTGNHGLEMDGDFTYSPNTGTVTATNFSGNLTGTLQTAAQANVTSLGTLTSLGLTGDISLASAAITWSTGAGLSTVGSEYSIQRDGAGTDHLQLNVPSGAGFKFSINAVEELIWSTGAFAFQQATTVSTSTGNLTLSAATGADVLIGDNATILYVDGGTNSLGINVAASANYTTYISRTFTASGFASQLRVSGALTGAVDADMNVFSIGANTLLEAASGTHAVAAGVALYAPTLTTAGGATTTNAATLYIAGAMAGAGTGNYALWVDAGTSRFDGDINLNDNDLLNVGAAGSDWDSTSLRNAGDYFGANGKGMVIGHTAKILSPQGQNEFQVLGTGNTDSSITIANFQNGDNGPAIDFVKSKSGTIGSLGAVTNGTPIGQINFGVDDTTNYRSEGARISAKSTAIATENAVSADLSFFTANATAGPTERMRISSTGQVHPGTNDGGSLGISGTAWADLFLASGAVVNFNAGDVTLTHSANLLTLAGGNLAIADNQSLALGTGKDSRIYYDGTDTFWNLRDGGTGDLMIALAGSYPSPDAGRVHIWEGSAGSIDSNVHTQLTIEHSDNAGINILTPNDKVAYIIFGDEDANNTGLISYTHDGNTMGFKAVSTLMALSVAGGVDLQSNAAGLVNVGVSGNDWTATAFTHDGGAIFNDTGADYDFRIETNDKSNMFVIDGGLNVISVGEAAVGRRMVNLGGTFTSDGSSDSAAVLGIFATLTGANGDLSMLTGLHSSANITTQGNSETIVNVVGSQFDEPNITVGSGDTVTNASTVRIGSAPTEGTNNYALFVDAGTSRFDGDINMSGMLTVEPASSHARIKQKPASGSSATFDLDTASSSWLWRNNSLATMMSLDFNSTLNLQGNASGGLLNVGASGSDWDSTSLRVAVDTFTAASTGLVVGHTAKITAQTATALQVLGTSQTNSGAILGRFDNGGAGSPKLVFVKSRNGSIGSNTIVADNDTVMTIQAMPDDGVDFATVAATFNAEVDDASPEAGGVGMAFVWSQMAGGGTSAARETMRINAAGTLEVGSAANTSTDKKLQLVVSNLTNINSLLVLQNSGTGSTLAGSGSAIRFQAGDANAGPSELGYVWAYTTEEAFGTDQYLAFRAGNAAPTTSNGQLVIKVNGNVGIGTASPVSKLELGTASGDAFVMSSDGSGNYRNALYNQFSASTIGNNKLIIKVSAAHASNMTTVATFTGAGNVGIGTSGPNAPLDVFGATGESTFKQRISYSSSIYMGLSQSRIDVVGGNDFHLFVGGSEKLAVSTAGHVHPGTNDGGSLGVSGTAWSDLFLADGAVVNWNAGEVTLTQTDTSLMLGGSFTKLSLQVGINTDRQIDFTGADAVISNAGPAQFYVANGSGSGDFGQAGNLFIQPRTGAARSIFFYTGSGTPVKRLTIGSTGAIFNDTGADYDFRIESNGSANMFVLDGNGLNGHGQVSFGNVVNTRALVNVSSGAITQTADTDFYRLFVQAQGAVTIPSGTANLVASLALGEPNITATGTVTNSATLYIESAAGEATNNYALWVDAGVSRFDGNIEVGDSNVSAGSITLSKSSSPNLIIQEDGQELWKFVAGSSGLYLQRDGSTQWGFSQGGYMLSYGDFRFQQAATLKTTTGVLTLDGDDGIVLQTTGSGDVIINENVGIGMSSPTFALNVEDSSSSETVARFAQTKTTGGWNHYTVFENDGASASVYLKLLQESAAGYLKYSGSNEFSIMTNGFNARMTIDANSADFTVPINASATTAVMETLSSTAANGFTTGAGILSLKSTKARVDPASSQEGPFIGFYQVADNTMRDVGFIGTVAASTYSSTASSTANRDHDMVFGVRANSGGLRELMRIQYNGNVGIGTDTTPDYKLDVQGTGRFDSTLSVGGAIDVQGGYANGGGAPYDGIVDAAGGGNWTTLQDGDDALDAATNTVMLVKSGTYSTLTVSTNNVRIVCEPGTIVTGAITLSGNNITLMLGTGCDLQAVTTLSGDGCSLLCENGVDLEGITSSGDYNTIDGGGWDTISYVASGQSAINVTGSVGTTIQNISAQEPTSNGYAAVGISGSLHRLINVRSIEGGGNGFSINATANENYISNCRVDNSDGASYMSNGPRNVFVGNIGLNAGTMGFQLTDTGDNTVVIGNIIEGQAGDSVDIDSPGEDCVVVGNRLDGAVDDNSGTSTVANNDETAF